MPINNFIYHNLCRELKYLGGVAVIVPLVLCLSSCSYNGYGNSGDIISVPLLKGRLADYGATPWYTNDITAGISEMKFALDTGANFVWATSDLCDTTACKAHNMVDTSQSGFVWVDKTRTKRSFGPWGDMYTYTGKIPFKIDDPDISSDITFFAAVEYEGDKFQDLAWDGGIGFPSRSDMVASGSGFFFHTLWNAGILEDAEFSIFTDDRLNAGAFFLGGTSPLFYDAEGEIRLEPKSSSIQYLWGTNLHDVKLGNHELSELTNTIFFLDTGSSRFKGDDTYVYPILDYLLQQKDSEGNPIFGKITENDMWTGLYYINGGPEDYTLLPALILTIGQSCYGNEQQAAVVGLDANQYSYLVEQGERAGQWVVAVHRLDGVGGLLVGSTFMDLLYTRFSYSVTNSDLSQGNMYLYPKRFGASPAVLGCTPLS